MDFFLSNLKETLEAINKLIDNNVNLVNTKRVRRCNNIKSSNRSKINFIWRALRYLEEEGILTPNGITNPKTYKITAKEKLDIDKVLSQIERNKKNRP
ncbi:MAG: hypothetical protein KAW51_10180 [Candidatus Lokiarchaeota archaeon]|nr:hypothetical protein [Candidatus Lokiarchaeota archaeon]